MQDQDVHQDELWMEEKTSNSLEWKGEDGLQLANEGGVTELNVLAACPDLTQVPTSLGFPLGLGASLATETSLVAPA